MTEELRSAILRLTCLTHALRRRASHSHLRPLPPMLWLGHQPKGKQTMTDNERFALALEQTSETLETHGDKLKIGTSRTTAYLLAVAFRNLALNLLKAERDIK